MKDDGTKQNKGWFGRKKPQVTPPQKVSRPPSASSFTPYRRKSQVPEVNATDDDLPPREEPPKRVGSPGSPPSQIEKKEIQETPDGNDDANQPAPTIPLHAGFDFAAIQDVLQESKGTDGGKPAASLLSPVPEHMIPPASPITRSGSAPPYTSTRPPSSYSQLSRDSTRGDADEDEESGALTPTFSRSLSLADTSSTARNDEFTSFNTLGPEVPPKPSFPSKSPSLSFGGYDGSVWQAGPNDVHQLGAAGFTPSPSLLGEGRANGSYGYLSSSPTVNPFTAQSPLSFGGPGGTIDYVPSTPIVPPSNNGGDPWTSSLTRGKKPISGLNSNPWA